ncbi:ankyrin repeat and MYND domain-containing protein 1-like [Cyprinus carpio]|uniref:Ankyrin repeat and MYND domain-containing protein 1-like n=1 Tax=Cyprinus carpio TaxID=7962 RepID=A0A9Q9XPC9_CYPCA|nr:ankyrin repeat and MYND domain-containing protein 1-like [Cyprinus carpio]
MMMSSTCWWYSGADVNTLSDEGMSALAVCHVLYYPLQSLHETLAERVTQNISPEPQIKPLEAISHESSPDPMTGTPKDESGQETFETPREINRIDQSLEPENLNNLEKLEAQEQINEDINEDEILYFFSLGGTSTSSNQSKYRPKQGSSCST